MDIIKKLKENTILYVKIRKLRYYILALFLYLIFLIILFYSLFNDEKKYSVAEFKINSPGAPYLKNGKLLPKKLVIRFGRSVAKIKDTGKQIKSGISISPKIKGKWEWKNDRIIHFTPSEHWKINQNYNLSFNKSIFSKHIKFKNLNKTFKTAPFTFKAYKPKFYINPKNPEIKKGIMTLSFSHPIKLEDLKDKFEIDKDSIKKLYKNKIESINLTVKLNKNRLKAYIHTEKLGIPDNKGKLIFKLNDPLESAWGGRSKTKTIRKFLYINGINDQYFINAIRFGSKKNEDDILERTMTVTSSGRLSKNNLIKSIELYKLPKDRPELFDSSYTKNYKWTSPEEITEDVLKLSTKLELELIQNNNTFDKRYSFIYDAKANDYLYIKINKGIKFRDGYILGKDYERIHHLDRFPQGLRILREGAILSLRGEKN